MGRRRNAAPVRGQAALGKSVKGQEPEPCPISRGKRQSSRNNFLLINRHSPTVSAQMLVGSCSP